MSDVIKIIETILSSIDGAQDVYRDEPIITTASAAVETLPEKYRQMRSIGSGDATLLLNEARLFFETAKFMEDFEDDYEYHGVFMKYFPTYRQMNDRQLRGYFSWRTAVRRKEVRETSLSFAFVYLYELINVIGYDAPEDAARALDDFAVEYSKYDDAILRYAARWRRDMSIYYGVPNSGEDEREKYERAAGVLLYPEEHGDDEVFGAISALSTYDPERSKLYKKHPAETKALVCRVFRAFSAFCGERRKNTLAERLFGRMCERVYVIFPSAIFYDRKKQEEREYAAPSGRVFKYSGGRWSSVWFPEITRRSSALGALIKEIDASLRPRFGLDPLASASPTRVLGGLVERECASYFEELRRMEASRVEFDLSLLDGIRASAEATRDMLITDEEEPDEPLFEDAQDDAADDGKLTDLETSLLKIILDGGDAGAFAKRNGAMLSVVIESINEKLFDLLCDTAIEFYGDTPRAVEDYIDELKGLIK